MLRPDTHRGRRFFYVVAVLNIAGLSSRSAIDGKPCSSSSLYQLHRCGPVARVGGEVVLDDIPSIIRQPVFPVRATQSEIS
jgi:hypothetical protein